MLALTPDPSEEAEANELADRLRVALTRLPAQHAQVFCLRCVEGMSTQDVAHATGLSANNVGTVLSRARKRLEELLCFVKGQSDSVT